MAARSFLRGLLDHPQDDPRSATGGLGAWLGVSVENARANAFHAWHGFERVGTKKLRIVVRERALRDPLTMQHGAASRSR